MTPESAPVVRQRLFYQGRKFNFDRHPGGALSEKLVQPPTQDEDSVA